MVDNVEFLHGERLYLRPLVEGDLDGPYVSWLNDEEVCRGNSHHVFPYERTRAEAYLQHANTTDRDLILACVLHEGHRHIGNVALQGIDWISRTADFAILLGDKSVWNEGYGTEAARLLLTHGFRALNLRRVTAATYDFNTAMRRLALELGMTEEGVRRSAAFKEGRYADVVEYGILRDEYERAASSVDSEGRRGGPA
jgi:RimJ/RimL family protein N-acetyltransferase